MSLDKNGYALHLNPAWRHRANFIIDAEIRGEQKKYEQLWVRKIQGVLIGLNSAAFQLFRTTSLWVT
jgi:hypothetical protein